MGNAAGKDQEMNPTKKELLAYARWRDGLPSSGHVSLVAAFVHGICEFHNGLSRRDCFPGHQLTAYSLALDGEDVDELL